MSDESGWIKLHRSILKQPWFNNSNTVHLFIYLLLRVNRVNGYKIFFKGVEYELKAGEYWSTFERLSKETGLTRQNLRTSIMSLKSTNTLTSHSSSQGTVYSLLNWNTYQEVTRKVTNDQPTGNQRVTTEQELKKERTKERTRTNSARRKKCEKCENETGWVTLADGLALADCGCLDKTKSFTT